MEEGRIHYVGSTTESIPKSTKKVFKIFKTAIRLLPNIRCLISKSCLQLTQFSRGFLNLCR